MDIKALFKGFSAYGASHIVINGTPVDKDAHTLPVFAMLDSARKDEIISELEQHLHAERIAREAAEQKSLTDHLTGLPNRFALDAYLHAETPKSKRWDNDKKLCLIFIDIDGLKQINDCYGHVAGDSLLKTASKFFKHHLRGDDTIYRIGGDEMMIVAIGNPATIGNKMTEMQKSFESKTLRVNVCGNWKEIPLWGFSYGLHISNPEQTAHQNYDVADKLMYDNKSGRKAAQAEWREQRTAEMLHDKTLIKAAENGHKETGFSPSP